MWTRQNKTRLGEWEYSIQKPMANNVTMRNGLFVALVDWYIVPADETTEIEWCAINDRFSWENNEHRYCIYQPKRDWETFTMEVDNGTITQEDVGKTFRITWGLQHINYATKADVGWQFRLEEVLNDNLWTFTYNKATQFAPQGPQGNDGQTPELEIWTVAKLQPDANPTAELVQDPLDPVKYILNLGIPAWATGPKWAKGDTGANGQNWRDWTDGQDWQNGDEWEPGEPWASPKWKGDRTGGTTYYYLNMVRYPDTDNVYWTWIWDYLSPSTGTEVPGVHANWKKMNRDWEAGPQWEQWGTIVIPVEGKPWKDGIWVDWRDWQDWVSPHNEGIWNNYTNYSKLALVRAFTWEYNAFWWEIRGRFITKNWAFQDDPADGWPWELVVKDWNWLQEAKDYMDELSRNCASLWLEWTLNFGKTFYDDTSNAVVEPILFDRYTGNKDLIMDSWTLRINVTWHYQVSGHCIMRLNTGTNKYLNIWRFSVALGSSRSWSAQTYILATAKEWGPYVSSNAEGPWLDLSFCVQVDLYEWDILVPFVRAQSDTVGLKTQWAKAYYSVIWWDDTSWQVPWQLDLDWHLSTYVNVEMISYETFNEWNIWQSI